MTHNANNSTFTTSGLNRRFKGNKGESGARGEVGNDGINGPANVLISTQTASYTLILKDTNVALIEMDLALANTLTIPPNSDVNFPVGAQILAVQKGAGQTTITPGAGVTILSADSLTNTRVQNSGVTMIQRAVDIWYVFGDIA